ncbi:hypothetical protein A9A59_0406 [Tepidiforma thermophila]|uniref:Uncharacterized protein n=1 Tax=Tepidiforma thermophila (strain KCTC 52669 / CGMCC 1.13589 / G233) TaxID=2761530 RepID=A0A2A9HDI5_TEPT2|nr:hypothetical protein A9A59_0406 [Tepidiforma thermophila]
MRVSRTVLLRSILAAGGGLAALSGIAAVLGIGGPGTGSAACPPAPAGVTVAASGAVESLGLLPELADAAAAERPGAIDAAGLPLRLEGLEPVPGFSVRSVEVRTAAGATHVRAFLEDPVQRRGLRIAAWTQCGGVTLVRPASSPVVRELDLDIHGWAFRAFVPSERVAGGFGPREAWAASGQWVVAAEGTGFTSDGAFIAALEAVVRGTGREG